MKVRTADVSEAPALAALVRSAYRGEESRAGWTTEADLLDDERIDVPTVVAKIEHGAVLVCAVDGEIVGCCEVVPRAEGLAYFGMFAVRPKLQAGGIGRLLLGAAEEHARVVYGATTMEMTVINGRHELIAWYERRGYRVTAETRPFPFHELVNGRALREDLHFVVLTKPLETEGTPFLLS